MGMMAQTLPPIPKGGEQPSEGPPLASAPQEAPQGNEVRDKAQSIMRQLMDERSAHKGLIENYPAAAKALRKADEGLKEAMLIILREVQQTPGSQPSPPVGPG